MGPAWDSVWNPLFPDNIHHPNFPQAVFGPGKDYEAETIYQFV